MVPMGLQGPLRDRVCSGRQPRAVDGRHYTSTPKCESLPLFLVMERLQDCGGVVANSNTWAPHAGGGRAPGRTWVVFETAEVG